MKASENNSLFSVTVSDKSGVTESLAARLLYKESPVINKQPQSQRVKKGEIVTLSVSATGQTNLNYDWYKGNKLVKASSQSYVFKMDDDTEGDYIVKVSDSDRVEVISEKATVTFFNPPEITKQPVDTAKKINEELTLSVDATGTGKLTYQWFKGTTAVSGANNAKYSFIMSNEKIGDYRVKVSNEAGEIDSKSVNVRISEPPVITSHPVDVNIREGQLVNLSVIAKGNNLTYQWYRVWRDGSQSDISYATQSTYPIFMEENKNTAGSYKVKVSNRDGEVYSNIVKVEILKKPEIYYLSPSVSKKAEEYIGLSIGAKGENLEYQWYKGNTAINGENKSVYTFKLEYGTDGEYKVKVSNDYGEVMSDKIVVTCTSGCVEGKKK